MVSSRVLGLAVGLLLDRALGEPPDAWHPVAWFGTSMQQVEQLLYADSRVRGTAHAVIGVHAAAPALGRPEGSHHAVRQAVDR